MGHGTRSGGGDVGGGREAGGAAPLGAADPPLAASGTRAGTTYSPRLLPSAPWFAAAGASSLPCAAELGCRGCGLRLLAWGWGEISRGSGRDGKRATWQAPLSGLSCWFIFFLWFCFCNSVFTWAPLSVIKGSKETCCNNSKDNQMES